MSADRAAHDARRTRSVPATIALVAIGVFFIGHGGYVLTTPPEESVWHQATLVALIVAGVSLLIGVSIDIIRGSKTTWTFK
ncbi:hypothetical protein O2W15_10140 [Modestobacter sp. VKM Ac-2979]|uniref:hypothetical protein n=1 Tax=unclassified Modestobacter TaxID=2643866 RepID=UPI0022AB6B63|nr:MULTISPECIES: hypothetical protein [unclassified Modestobacter]MCZ2811797.1 hypothetical protein [Modestobacter sp. VKM Ac-2979]MCZ2843520.1 hypothetical protein [Modestobacter sp. VKM Ac-2980]